MVFEKIGVARAWRMKRGEEKKRGWEISVETRAVTDAGGENRTKMKQNSGGWAGDGRREACCSGVLHSLAHALLAPPREGLAGEGRGP